MTGNREVNSQPNWERNSFYERLIELRRTNRKAFDSLSTPTQYALAEYERQKRAHDQLQHS